MQMTKEQWLHRYRAWLVERCTPAQFDTLLNNLMLEEVRQLQPNTPEECAQLHLQALQVMEAQCDVIAQ